MNCEEKLRAAIRRAEAERDAQHDLVLRLTGERDEAKADAVRLLTAASQQAITNARRVAELTATRDLLTAENERLQARVATLELLLRGGK